MDYNLDIVLPELYVNKIGLKTRTFWWDRKEEICFPRQLFVDDKAEFIEILNGMYFDTLIRETHIPTSIILTINRKKYSVEEIIKAESINILFEEIMRINAFELYLWKDDESIEQEYEFLSTMNISEIMEKAIKNSKNIKVFRQEK